MQQRQQPPLPPLPPPPPPPPQVTRAQQQQGYSNCKWFSDIADIRFDSIRIMTFFQYRNPVAAERFGMRLMILSLVTFVHQLVEFHDSAALQHRRCIPSPHCLARSCEKCPPHPPPQTRAVCACQGFFYSGGLEGEEGGGAVKVAAHSRTCTRWLWVSATTMRPSLSMAMPPQGHLNSSLPEP